ncbi:WecB/TagA/CpsF family glycosyltransferase [Sinomicrobium sp.]
MKNTPINILKDKLRSTNTFGEGVFSFVNPYSYLIFRKKLALFQKLDGLYVDGVGLVYMLKLCGLSVKRASFDMTSMAPQVFEKCVENGWSIYFIGSTEEAISQFARVVEQNYPQLNVVGYRNGYFSGREEREDVIRHIRATNPNVIVAGMGTPYQELFLTDLKDTGWSGLGYSCGGFIHQTAKGIDYYPHFYDKYNLRWLYRIIDEPKLVKRYAVLYPKSLFLFLCDLARYAFLRYK